MTTKFNKDMYAKMRAKKDEPLSNIGKKTVRIMGRGSPAGHLSYSRHFWGGDDKDGVSFDLP